jgi:hypothetical protein
MHKEIAEDLLDLAEAAVHVDEDGSRVNSQHVLEMLSQRGLSYVSLNGCRPASSQLSANTPTKKGAPTSPTTDTRPHQRCHRSS